jgi:hypothetical protein
MDSNGQDTADYIAITRLQHAYADVVNRRAWPELVDVFRPDAVVALDLGAGEPIKLEGPAAVGTFIGTSIARFDLFEFVILNTHVLLAHRGDPDCAAARVYMNEIRHEEASGRWTMAYGLYQDQYRRIDGRWWIAGRHYNSMARTGRDLEILTPPPDRLA